MSREHHATIIVGRKHTGKSTLANKIATSKAYKNKRVLIINVNNSPAYAAHPKISYDQLRAWNGAGIYQFYDRDHDRMFSTLLDIFDPDRRLFNGLIIFEDCTKYIDANPPKHIRSFLVDHRMWDADLLFTFHALSFVPPKFWGLTTRLLLLKTQEVLSTRKSRHFEDLIPNWNEVQAAFHRVKNHKDNYYRELIKTDR